MRDISNEMRDHLDEGVTTLTACWKITRLDNEIFCFTEGTRELEIDGFTYLPQGGFLRSAFANDSTMNASNMEAMGYFDDDTILETDLRAGLFVGARVEVFYVNWADLTMGVIPIMVGRLGQTHYSSAGVFKTELRGLAAQMAQPIGEVYTPLCRSDLGDPDGCGIMLYPETVPRSTLIRAQELSTTEAYEVWRVADPGIPAVDGDGKPDSRTYHDVVFVCTTEGTTAGVVPAYDYTVGNETTDGTAVFLAQEAWVRSGEIATVTNSSTVTVTWEYTDPRLVDSSFANGVLTFETGPNAGSSVEIKTFDAGTDTITLFLNAKFLPEVGDRIVAVWGCSHTLTGAAGCVERFQNVWNYRGEPFIPGPDQLLYYPNAGGGGTAYQDTTYSNVSTGNGKF